MEPVTTALAGIALVKKSVDFIKENIQIHWMTYGPYKRYDQLHSYNNFENNVSIIDLLFNVGLKNSYRYIKSIRESL